MLSLVTVYESLIIANIRVLIVDSKFLVKLNGKVFLSAFHFTSPFRSLYPTWDTFIYYTPLHPIIPQDAKYRIHVSNLSIINNIALTSKGSNEHLVQG